MTTAPRHNMAVALSLKKINAELLKGGHTAMGDGYFYFWGGDAADWLDRTVRVPTVHSLTLEQWLEQFRMLKEKNRQLLSGKMNEKDFKKHLAELAEGKPEAEHTHGGGAAPSRQRTKPGGKQGAKQTTKRKGKV